MRFIEALEQGLISEFGKPDRVVVTAISRLSFFGDRVVKVYKHEVFFFADLLNFESRKKFYEDDFFWNHSSSPDIYIKLGMADGGKDFYIEMRKIDGEQTLTNLLPASTVTISQMEAMTEALVERLRFLTKAKMDSYSYLFREGWKKVWDTYASHDMAEWMYLADSHIPRTETDRVAMLLQSAGNKDTYFSNFDLSLLAVQIDNNCDNLLFLNGKPAFIDSMPPKEDWRVFDEAGVIARTAVDAYVLGSQELGDAVYRTYGKYRQVPPAVKKIYELRAACIQWPYRYMLKQDDVAKKYGEYAKQKMSELQALL